MTIVVRLLLTDLAGVLRGTEKIVNEPAMYKPFFDASSVYGFESIENSDLLLKCIDEKLFEAPWREDLFICLSTIHYPDGKRYIKDPRLVSEKLAELLDSLGYKAVVGAEMEFFPAKDIRVDVSMDKQILEVDAPEASWKNGAIPPKQGYHLVEPIDEVAFLRGKIVEYLTKIGLE